MRILIYVFFFNYTSTTEIYTLSLHDPLPISLREHSFEGSGFAHPDILLTRIARHVLDRSEEHTSELQSQFHLVCRLLLEKKKTKKIIVTYIPSLQTIYNRSRSNTYIFTHYQP